MTFQNKDYVPLHCHSFQSILDGLAPINKFVMRARGMGFPAIALTDHGNMGGTIKFIKECNSTKDKDGNTIPYPIIKPCVGEEFYMSGSRFWKTKEEQTNGQKGNCHINIFAKNFKGYENLCTLSEKSWTEGFYFSPRIDLDLLYKYHEGLMCSSACLGSIININLLYGRYDIAKRITGIFKDIFGEDFYLEIMYHGMGEEKAIIPDIIKLGKELDIKLIATQDSHFLYKEQAKSHEVLLCMSTSDCLTNPKHFKFPTDEFYLKSAEEMYAIFKDIPDSLYNPLEFSKKIDDKDISKNLFRNNMRLPKFEIPEEFRTTNDDFEDRFNYLKKLVGDGMKRRGWDKSEKHIKQVEIELNDTKIAWTNNGYDFVTYFLIKWDLMNEARKRGIFTARGRGSAYASIILHCLGICSGVDPLKHSLLWQRFLGFSELQFIRAEDLGFEEEKQIEIDDIYEEDEDNGLEDDDFEEEF